ncbi:MAG: EAL domain-containing protein [Oscillospiraceae bacterium]|nr:EAL domain-containing protein [Oscillospiraceae bacterium]
MIASVSFDIAGLFVLTILIMSVILRKMTKGNANRLFMLSMLSALIACSFDIISVFVDHSGADNAFIITFAHTGYLIFHNAQAPLHVFFLINFTDTWHKVRRNVPLKVVLFVPYAITLLLLLINPFTKMLFTVADGYEHSWGFYTMYGLVAPYIVVDSFYVLKYRNQMEIRKILALFSMVVFLLIAIVIHLVVPVLRVECFANAAALLMVSVTIQRPEDYIDTFTGLYKHSAYANDLRRTFKNGKHVHIVMINIGNYSAIQNMIGYEMSIVLLKDIAERIENIALAQKARCSLYFLDRGRYRMVFDEDDRDKAEECAEAVVNELKERSRFSGFDITLTPCVVLARCPEEIESFKSLMAFGMDFHEKHAYSGRYVEASEVYDPEEFAIQNNIDSIIDRALERNSFQVYYQPIYSVERGKFVSAEALLRLYDDEHGFISPEILVPAAERSGAIHKIGAFVFEEVCKFISGDEYKRLGLDYIEVNLSVAQCMHSDLADLILDTMRKYDICADSINLEITETAASYAQRVMQENLNKLSRAGLSFSLDDYGTGYSNMKRVISLPLKIVKLDKSFVDEQHNPKMWIFLQNTVKMLKDMKMEIVVEGIETHEMVEMFSNLKCDFIQGYFFSKPLCKDEFVRFITASSAALGASRALE